MLCLCDDTLLDDLGDDIDYDLANEDEEALLADDYDIESSGQFLEDNGELLEVQEAEEYQEYEEPLEDVLDLGTTEDLDSEIQDNSDMSANIRESNVSHLDSYGEVTTSRGDNTGLEVSITQSRQEDSLRPPGTEGPQSEEEEDDKEEGEGRDRFKMERPSIVSLKSSKNYGNIPDSLDNVISTEELPNQQQRRQQQQKRDNRRGRRGRGRAGPQRPNFQHTRPPAGLVFPPQTPQHHKILINPHFRGGVHQNDGRVVWQVDNNSMNQGQGDSAPPSEMYPQQFHPQGPSPSYHQPPPHYDNQPLVYQPHENYMDQSQVQQAPPGQWPGPLGSEQFVPDSSSGVQYGMEQHFQFNQPPPSAQFGPPPLVQHHPHFQPPPQSGDWGATVLLDDSTSASQMGAHEPTVYYFHSQNVFHPPGGPMSGGHMRFRPPGPFHNHPRHVFPGGMSGPRQGGMNAPRQGGMNGSRLGGMHGRGRPPQGFRHPPPQLSQQQPRRFLPPQKRQSFEMAPPNTGPIKRKKEPEDEETRLYRLKIEEQKKLRERILQHKEQRRKMAALEKQRQLHQQGVSVDAQAGGVFYHCRRHRHLLRECLEDEGEEDPRGGVVEQGAEVVLLRPIHQTFNSQQFIIVHHHHHQPPAVPSSAPGGLKVLTVRNSAGQTRKVLGRLVQTPQGPKIVPAVPGSAQVQQRRVVISQQAGQKMALTAARQVMARGRGNTAQRGGVARTVVLKGASGPTRPGPQQGVTPQRIVIPKGQQAVGRVVIQKQGPTTPTEEPSAPPVPSLPRTKVVAIDNLAATTTESQLRKMCRPIGPLESMQMYSSQRKAVLTFTNPTSAALFFKRYQRKMVDLSLINVTLVVK
uniref:RRM domain-containing protein n=1 Tax=Timema genevievae TaxID=629358 RepID=A0A7R9JW49_TIMGE|nr:unnamed protein product [Timema genevievae]